MFWEVQFAFFLIILLGTFSRSECPCPKTFTGKAEPRPSRRLSDGRLPVSGSGSSIEAQILPAGSIGLRWAVQPAKGLGVVFGLDLRSWVVALTRLPLCSLMNLQSPTYATKFTAA